VLDGASLGKPRDRAHGLAMLEALAGREHRVLTAVALVTATGTRCVTSASTVRMRASTPQERDRYWDTGEPRDKAGGYAIQGLGAIFIESLQGSYSGVMGLPLFETAQLLTAASVPCWNSA
jgi:septum formation protein